MTILLVHNRYQQAGGEDAAFDSEAALLSQGGESVAVHVVTNDTIASFRRRAVAALTVAYNRASHDAMRRLIDEVRPRIMHVHNFFPLFSPSIYDAAEAAGVPVVQTLHNFRVACSNALFLRHGAPCRLCVDGSPFQAVRYRCYRDSLLGSLAVSHMIAWHRRHHTWIRKVSRFIALSEFARCRFVEAGLPAERIVVKPNPSFVPDLVSYLPRRAVLYVGRLSEEKGIRVLVAAAALGKWPLRVIGDGPLRDELQEAAPVNVAFLGRLGRRQVFDEIARAVCVVIPSICYENFPVVVAESYGHATPVVASRIGSLAELIEDGNTGVLCRAGDAQALAEAVRVLVDDPALAARLGAAARACYERHFSPQRNLQQLREIYRSVLEENGAHGRHRGYRQDHRAAQAAVDLR